MTLQNVLSHKIIKDRIKKDSLEFLEIYDTQSYKKFRTMCSNFWEDFGLVFQEELIDGAYYITPNRVMVGMHPISEFHYMVMVLSASKFLFNKNESLQFHIEFLREVYRRTLFDQKPKKFDDFIKVINKIVKSPMIEIPWGLDTQIK